MLCIVLWSIVGCDRPDTRPEGTRTVPVSIEPTHTPVATATLRSRYCPWGQAIMGCDN
jgi:hypothetical protein